MVLLHEQKGMRWGGKLGPKKFKGVEYQGSGQKGLKGTLGKTLRSKGSPMVTGVRGDSSSSFPVISSFPLKQGGYPIVIIKFLWGEGGAGVGAIKT